MNDKNGKNEEYTILDLPKIIKIAREHTLLGKYETSLKKYQIALELIESRKKEVNVGVLKDKWQMTELNIKSEIGQTKQMLEACKSLTNIDFNFYKKQIESDDIKKHKLREKGIMVFDMSKNNQNSTGPTNYFGSAPFSFNEPSKQDPFSIFQKDQINGLMGDSISSEINEDDDKILNPLKPQKNFGKKNNKKKFGNITGINVISNNNKNKQNKVNPWFTNEKTKTDISNNAKNDKSLINPLDQFNISNTKIAGLDESITSNNNVTLDNNSTFIKDIKNFMKKKGSYVEISQKKKNLNFGNNKNSNPGKNTNKNIINYDKKTANKGALPIIMKKENQKILNYSKQKMTNDLTKDNDLKPDKKDNNDISAINMIDDALQKIGHFDNDESSLLDNSKYNQFLK